MQFDFARRAIAPASTKIATLETMDHSLACGMVLACTTLAARAASKIPNAKTINAKITLLAILALSRQKPSKRTTPNLNNLSRLHPRAHLDVVSLGRRGLLEERDGVYRLFSPSFVRWVGREIAAPAGEEEGENSVEAWLREGGRESLEQVKGVLPRFRKKYWPVVGALLRELSMEFAAATVSELASELLRFLT